MSSTFVIDDGLHEVIFKNNKGEVFCEFSFNPADTGILNRYDKFVEWLESQDIKDEDDFTERIKVLDADIKEKVNEMIGREVSDGIFKVYTPCTFFANGDMFVEVLLQHIGDVIEKETNARVKKKVAKIKKATAKNRV